MSIPLRFRLGAGTLIMRLALSKHGLGGDKESAGIPYEFYCCYYKGKKTVVAYKLGNVTAFAQPKNLEDFRIAHPPQSFTYL